LNAFEVSPQTGPFDIATAFCKSEITLFLNKLNTQISEASH
jgi:hypothetical protein